MDSHNPVVHNFKLENSTFGQDGTVSLDFHSRVYSHKPEVYGQDSHTCRRSLYTPEGKGSYNQDFYKSEDYAFKLDFHRPKVYNQDPCSPEASHGLDSHIRRSATSKQKSQVRKATGTTTAVQKAKNSCKQDSHNPGT